MAITRRVLVGFLRMGTIIPEIGSGLSIIMEAIMGLVLILSIGSGFITMGIIMHNPQML